MSGRRSQTVRATFTVSWDKTILTKQTLFPVWGEKEDRKPRKGIPGEGQEYTLRATKGVNMHPFPLLKLDKSDGSKYTEDEEVRLSVVCSTDKLVPPVGSCTCGGAPILSESKQFQLQTDGSGNLICKMRGGVIEFTKLQIGCCTGQRGHNCSFCIKAEFTREGSPIKGLVVYSLPIDVGAKGPFAKVFVKQDEAAVAEPTETKNTNTQIVEAHPVPSYEGAEEMVLLMKRLNLTKYIPLFTEQEVDIQAFLQLTDEDLKEIGIDKVGPRVKILKEIARIQEARGELRTQLQLPPLPATPLPALPSTPHQPLNEEPTLQKTPSLPRIASLPSLPSFSMAESLSSPMLAALFGNDVSTNDPPAKRRKTLEGFPSSGSFADLEDKQMSIYIYLSNIVASNNILKKTLFIATSAKNKWETEQIVQQIQHQVVTDLTSKGKYVFHEGKAQLMLVLQPDKNGGWQAKSAYTEQVWNFKKGDYIKIDNHHNVDISINVHYYVIPSSSKSGSDKQFIEEFRSPKKYPTLFPGGSLEIGIDENRDGRLALAAELDIEPSETFAVTKNGKLFAPVANDSSMFNETCNFSFKRRKDNMKKAESFDDFQKEIFLSKCLDTGML